MKQLFYLFISIGSMSALNAQPIVSYDWNSSTATVSTIGPSPISISSSARSHTGGNYGTKGLNPSLPKQDLNMTFDGSYFDVNGIDITIDFQRDESVGSFVSRGSGFDFGMNGGNLSVKFRVDNGMGGHNTINSGNVFSIPNDDVFRTYRFFYLPSSGQAALLVDNSIVWSYDGPDSRNLNWSGAGDLVVGLLMDGNGADKTVFDNLMISSVTTSPLPIELTRFDVEEENENTVAIRWTTASESNNDHFEIERSADGMNWDVIGKTSGTGNSNSTTVYESMDYSPLEGLSYYRLVQTDRDGNSTIFPAVSIERSFPITEISVYPNPVSERLTIRTDMSDHSYSVELFDLSGRIYSSATINNGTATIDVSSIPDGSYYVAVKSGNNISGKQVMIRH
ncbi:MAG: T9SS type A sorting domain-containing protein [Flavobacteriales bacterium]|nr:T9SS type A sorting domain-containing protein [Flavobacteriales bacterium]